MSGFKLLFILSLSAAGAQAYFLDHFKIQHAGEIGELAMGVGKRFGNVYSLDYMHGLAREETGGTTIETIALKNNFDFFDYAYNESLLELYAGVAAYHVTGLKYQASRDNNFPSRYYSIGSFRGLFYLGAKAKLEAASLYQGYFESGINDVWLLNYVNNPRTLNFFEYISLALGYTRLF